MKYALRIKNYSLLLAILCSTTILAQKNDTLMTLGGNPIMVDEFEYIYQKNNGANAIDKKTVSESIDMFVNYKLKVIEAQAQGLDTLKLFLNEFNGYRKQLAKPYMTDMDMQDKLYREAYEHLKQDVEVSHVLIQLPKKSLPKDTLVAYKEAQLAAKRLQTEPFDVVAGEMSDDHSVKDNKGYLGFFTGLSVVWPFEQAMYALPINQISQPVRTNYGYHVLKVHSRRPAKGRVRASHIMKQSDAKMTAEKQQKALDDINDIYTRLMAGASFEELAKKESDDRTTGMKNGDLSWFGIGRMVKPFEDAVFQMEVGETSKPIQTQFGWHIIKMTDQQAIESYENKKADIRRSMQQDARSADIQKSFMNKLKKEYHLYKNTSVLSPIIKLLKEHGSNDSIILELAPEYKDVIVAFKDNLIPARKYIEYCVDNNITNNLSKNLDKFSERELLKYEDSLLEAKYPEFRLLMGEYYGGLLLFEISSREVWDKTSKDVKGLTKFFKKNKKNYAWSSPRYKGIILKASDENVAKAVLKLYPKVATDSIDRYIKETMGDSAMFVIEKGLWKEGDNNVVDAIVFKKDETLIPKDNLYPTVIVKGKLQKKYPASYVDVRGLVSSDYQNYLEKSWVEALREKYPIVINEKVMDSVLRAK